MSKKILITGASDGIGRAMAIRLSRDGHEIILCGRDEARLDQVAVLCKSKTQVLAFDINDQKSREAQLGPIKDIDVLINNAGIWQKLGDLEDLSDEQIQLIISTNLTSQILITKQLLLELKKTKGLIINVVSKSGIAAQPGQTVYTASKYGMRGFTDVLRQDLTTSGVRVSAVYQSGTNTNMFKKAGDDLAIETFTEPDDLADAVAYIVNAPAKMVIHEIRVDRK